MPHATTENQSSSSVWINAVQETLAGYRNLIDRTVDQLSDEQLVESPTPGINSVAIILRHLGGNLQSRWTDFLTSDGEKESRDRDREFEPWQGTRQELLDYFAQGWSCLQATLDSLTDDDIAKTIKIRGESHSVPAAIQRSITHISYHVGQILLVGRWAFDDNSNWQWLSIAPGKSQAHNQATWGTAASRAAMGQRETNDSDT